MPVKYIYTTYTAAILDFRSGDEIFMLAKSPSGSLCPYYYKGGELHPLHYGSYHNNTDKLIETVLAEEEFILSSNGGRKIWVDLYETCLDKKLCEFLANHFVAIGHKTAKLALVGCTLKARLIFNKMLRQKGYAARPRYFMDPEIAKDWLVGLHV